MELEQETSLFEIRVNEHGQTYIRKFCRLIIPVFIFLVLTLTINLYVSVRYIAADVTSGNRAVKIPFTMRVTPYFTILTSMVNFLAVIFYVRFANSLKLSLAKNDEQMFNGSFRHLSQNAILFLLTLIMTFITWCWSLAGGWLLGNF